MEFVCVSKYYSLLRNNVLLIEGIQQNGKPWYGIQIEVMNALPDVIDEEERRQIAYNIVPQAMNEIFGDGNWDTEKRPKKSGAGTTSWIIIK